MKLAPCEGQLIMPGSYNTDNLVVGVGGGGGGLAWVDRLKLMAVWLRWWISVCLFIFNLRETFCLKLLSLFAAWLFWTFHIKFDNIKVLIILRHSWSSFLPLTNLYGIRYISSYHSSPRFPMQIEWPWPPVGRFSHGLIIKLKTKENVNIKLFDLCESLIVYILHTTCQWVHMALAINRPDILLM